MNPLESPAIIKLLKDPKEFGNVFQSPSAILNGGKEATAVDVTKSPSIRMLTRAGTQSADAMKSPAIINQGIKEDAIKNAMSSPSLQMTSEVLLMN